MSALFAMINQIELQYGFKDMKLAFIRLAKFFGSEIITLQQIVDNTSLSTEEILNLDILINDQSEDFKAGSKVQNIVQAKINGAGKVQYWKGVLSNV